MCTSVVSATAPAKATSTEEGSGVMSPPAISLTGVLGTSSGERVEVEIVPRWSQQKVQQKAVQSLRQSQVLIQSWYSP